jgi:hypothetical protein
MSQTRKCTENTNHISSFFVVRLSAAMAPRLPRLGLPGGTRRLAPRLRSVHIHARRNVIDELESRGFVAALTKWVGRASFHQSIVLSGVGGLEPH